MILIIQTGDPVKEANQKFGSFAQWFIQGMGLRPTQYITVDVHHGQKLPDLTLAAEKLTGIVITGSAAMVTDHDPWLLSTQNWLSQIFRHEIPTLGVCFGHQMLATVLGGTVNYNDKGRHMGHSQCTLTVAAKSDSLLTNLRPEPGLISNTFQTFVSHLQVVTDLPQSATLLGSTDLDENHLFRAEKNLWGLQFHPEWTVDIMSTYIKARTLALIDEGFDPNQMIQSLKPCDTAYRILGDFIQLTNQSGVNQNSAL